MFTVKKVAMITYEIHSYMAGDKKVWENIKDYKNEWNCISFVNPDTGNTIRLFNCPVLIIEKKTEVEEL